MSCSTGFLFYCVNRFSASQAIIRHLLSVTQRTRIVNSPEDMLHAEKRNLTSLVGQLQCKLIFK